MQARARVWLVRLAIAGYAVATHACTTDLGPCTSDDSEQARGWVALQQSCSGGTCHSSAATGTRRNAAPSGLDWDDPRVVRDFAPDIWDAIESDEMPPASWVVRVPDAALSDDERSALRQFLACGSRTVVAP